MQLIQHHPYRGDRHHPLKELMQILTTKELRVNLQNHPNAREVTLQQICIIMTREYKRIEMQALAPGKGARAMQVLHSFVN